MIVKKINWAELKTTNIIFKNYRKHKKKVNDYVGTFAWEKKVVIICCL